MELKQRLNTFWSKLISCPLHYPVEALGALWLFVTLTWVTAAYNGSNVYPWLLNHLVNAAFYVVPVMTLAMRLRQAGHRLFYWLTPLALVALSCFDLGPERHPEFVIAAYLIGILVLLYQGEKCDNERFARHGLYVVLRLLFAGVCGLLIMLAWTAIVNSISYIFNLELSSVVRMVGCYFGWTIVATLTFVMLYDEPETDQPMSERVLHVLLDYIVSPAVIVYAMLLYVYAAQILFTWNLPKGGVAYMVMGFLSVSLLARLLQELLQKRRYKWFYRNLPWIAIAPLLLFFVGTLYRIQLYSLTQSRVYLLFAGLTMVYFMELLVRKKNRSFALMPVSLGLVIIILTYIPGISAKAIGIHSQQKRLEKYITELNLRDPKTKLLRQDLDLQKVEKNETLRQSYTQVGDIMAYLQQQMGKEKCKAKYGKWNYYRYGTPTRISEEWQPEYYSRTRDVELAPYTKLLNENDYKLDMTPKQVLTLTVKGKLVLRSDLQERLLKGEDAQSLMVTRQGNFMVVIHQMEIDTSHKRVVSANTYNALVLTK